MKVIRHIHLEGDPFEFCRAYDYRTREQEIEKRLIDMSSLKKWSMLRKNLSWVMRRALIVVCELNNKIDVEDIWRKDDMGLCRCLRRNRCELKGIEMIIDSQIETLDDLQKEELCQNVKKITKEIQKFVWDLKKKDVYKKLRGYKYLQYRLESEVVFDINKL